MTKKKPWDEPLPKKARLECPKCVGILQQKVVGKLERNSVIIDICWNCTGIWLDRGELEHVLRLKYTVRKTAAHWIRPEHIDVKKANVKCPRCKVDMEQIPSMRNHKVTMDCCPKCIGVWLDGGELAVLQRGGYWRRLKDWISRRHGENVKEWKTTYRGSRH